MNRTAARRIIRAQVSALSILTATLVMTNVDVAAAHSDTAKSLATAGPPW
jgi:hypothetical protein